MQCTVEPREGNKVHVNVSVDVTEFERDVETAYRKLAREVRIAGFRPGKAPRKVIDAHLGEAGMKAARAQAIEDAVPKYLAEAVKQHDIDIIATPKVDHVHGAEELGAPISFHCEMEVRPVITVAGYAGLRVELPATKASESEIDDVINNERKRQCPGSMSRHGSMKLVADGWQRVSMRNSSVCRQATKRSSPRCPTATPTKPNSHSR
ncbi:MAG: trigger factor family protein [Actinobacteria bacterium]|nr:trigger factor family protein [Actinomycetota bacterium]